jgi:hypothetical protein
MATPQLTDAARFDLTPMDVVMRPFGDLGILYIYGAPASPSTTYDLAKLQRAFVAAVESEYSRVLLGELHWDSEKRGAGYILQDKASNAQTIPFAQEPKSALSTAEALESLSYELFMPPPRAETQIVGVKASLLADGGLAIGISVTHSVFDGESMFTFMKVWGQHYRGVRDGSAKEEPIQVSHDRHLMAPRGVGPKLEHPEFLVLPPKPSSDAQTPAETQPETSEPVPAPMLPATSRHVFHVTPDMMAKAKAAIGGPMDAEDYSYVSTIDSLTALFIALITRARGHGKDVKFTTGVNGRRRFSPPLPTNYVGNVVYNSLSTYSAEELAASNAEKQDEVAVSTLRTIARRVRASINRRDDAFLRDVIEFIGSQEDMSAVQVGTNFFFGPDLMATSWTRMGMYDADFGGGKASYAFMPQFPVCDGLFVFIEGISHQEGLDVVVMLESTALDRVKQMWAVQPIWGEQQ